VSFLKNCFSSSVFCTLLALITITPTLIAQQEPKAEPLLLSEKAQTALKVLQTLDELPLQGWRFHLGDIAHGEAVDLNDTDWKPIADRTNLSNDAIWFRKTVEVPKDLNGYDLTGVDISFKFNLSADRETTIIIYYNGRRVAMGTDLEPIALFNNAKPGDKVLIAVKALHTEERKRFNGSIAKINYSPTHRTDPHTLRLEAISAEYILPALLHDPSKEVAVLDKALDGVDLYALQTGQQHIFDLSLEAAQKQMENLRPVLSQASFHLTGNAHIDAAWLWPWTETVDVVQRTFGTALQLMYEYPKYTFSQSAAAYNEWLADKYPAMNQEIKDRVKEGRWEIVGGMWVEPDLNMPDGESQVRQLLIGKRFFKQQYGVDVRIGWNPDSFGYNWQLPQIYKKSGVDYFVTQKMTWNETNKLPLKLFWWQSPDGSRVLTYFPHDYVNDTQPERLASDFNIARQENPGLPEMMHLYGIGDHGGGPTRAMLDTAQQWMSNHVVFPPSNFATAQSYFSSVETKLDTTHSPLWNYETLAAAKGVLNTPPAGEISLPVWNDELYLEFHRGVYTSQAEHKRSMRESEEWLLDAEKWSSLSWLAGDTYPQEKLDEAWKKVLFNQFHDLAAGSGIGVIYRDAQKDYDVVRWTANEADRNAFATIFSQINTTSDTRVTAEAVPLIVLNPLAWSRTDVVSADVSLANDDRNVMVLDAENKPVLSQITSIEPEKHIVHLLLKASDMPSLGYEKFTVVPSASNTSKVKAPTTDLSISGTTLENEFLRVVVDAKTGCITSLYLKQTDTESLAVNACGNQLQAFHDNPKSWDAWNIDADALDHFTAIDQTDSVQVVDNGPLRAAIRIKRHWQSSIFEQQIVLYAGIPRVDIVNDFDWHETHVLLKAAFPLAASSAMATYEIPYGSIKRPTTRNNSWESAKFEVPALRWADLGDDKSGFSLINNSKYGYDAVGNLLRLSLLRSPISPDPGADKGTHHFEYSLYPHTSNWKQALTVRRGYEFNYKLQAEQTTQHIGPLPAKWSFINVEPANLLLTAVKKTEDGDGLLLRFYDWAGKSGSGAITVPKGVISATQTNLMERVEGASLQTMSGTVTDTVIVPFNSYGITTVQVNYGNRGVNFYSSAK